MWVREKEALSYVRPEQEERRGEGSPPTAVHLNICDLNNQMDSLCRALQAGRQKVIGANCQMTGACSPTEHVYAPGLFSSTNQDFASGTVATYYELFNPKLQSYTFDPSTQLDGRVCPLTGTSRDLLVKNEQFTAKCASRQMESLQKLIRIGRVMTDLIARTLYVLLNLFMSLLRLLVDSANRDEAVSDLKQWGEQLGVIWAEAANEIANLLYEMVFGSGMGQLFREIIGKVCWTINQILQFINQVKEWLAEGLSKILDGINGVLEKIPGVGRNGELDAAAKNLRKWGGQNSEFKCELGWDDPTAEIVGGVLPVPTRCYTEYIASIDDSNALSCSRADTCRREDLLFGSAAAEADGTDPVLCDTCPASLVSGTVVQYGCDVLTSQCACGARVTERTSCTANYQCYLPEASCDLMTDQSTGRPSGGMPCKQCSFAEPVCLVTDGGTGAGRCSCLLRGAAPTMCEAGVGPLDRVSPSAGTLCAASLDPAAAQGSSGTLDWKYLVTAPCELVDLGSTFCYDVHGKGLLAVGLGVPDTGLLGRRRLLQDDDDDDDDRREWQELEARMARFERWNETAPPCSQLALLARNLPSWQGMGVLDREALRSCVRWVEVGGKLIRSNGMDALAGHDSLLLSPADFSRAVMQKGALSSLVRTPMFWTGAALAHPWAAPLRSLTGRVALYLHTVSVDMRAELEAQAGNGSLLLQPLLNTTLGRLASTMAELSGVNVSEAEGAGDAQWILQQAREFGAAQRGVLQELGGSGLSTIWEGGQTNQGRRRQGASDRGGGRGARGSRSFATRVEKPSAKPALGPRRKLQQVTTEDPRNAVDRYTSLVASLGAAGGTVPLGGPLADIWVQGPIGWPPRFEYWAQDKECVAASIFWDLATDALATVVKAYKLGFSPDRFKLNATRMAEQVPVFYPGNETEPTGSPSWRIVGDKGGATAAYLFEWFGENVLYGLLGLTPGNIAAFFGLGSKQRPNQLTLGLLVRDLVVCDFEATTLCTRHDRDLWDSLVLTFAFYTVISLLASSITGAGPALLLWGTSPWMVLYLAYGYSPSCTPQVPVCLGSDVVGLLGRALPLPIRWPDSLQKFPGCLSGNKSDLFPDAKIGTADCLLSCSSDPFLFDGRWETPAAWVACGLVRNCSQVKLPWAGNLPAFEVALAHMQGVLEVSARVPLCLFPSPFPFAPNP